MDPMKRFPLSFAYIFPQGLSVVISIALLFTGTFAPLAEAQTQREARNFWATRKTSNFNKQTNNSKHPLGVNENSFPRTPLPPGFAKLAEPAGDLRSLKEFEPWTFKNKVIPSFTFFQDAHGNPAYQRTLSQIICRLAKENPKTPLLIAVEGAWGKMDLSWWRKIPTQYQQRWAEAALSHGWMTGEEHAALTLDENQIRLVGVDDPPLHKQNTKARMDVERFRGSLPLRLRLSELQLLSLARQTWPDSLIRWQKIWSEFEQGTMSAPKLANLARAAIGPSWDKKAFPQLSALADMEGSTIPRSDKIVEDLLKVISPHSSEFALALKQIGTESAPPLDRIAAVIKTVEQLPETEETRILMKHLTQHQSLLSMAESLKTSMVLEEIETLRARGTKSILQNNCVSPLGARLYFLLERTRLVQRLVGLEMTPDEWENYKIMSETEPTENYLRDLAERVAAFRDKTPLLSFDELKAWKAAERFYDLAVQRNEKMLAGALAESDKTGATRVILVAGGFHSPGIKQMMRQSGTPYQVFTPSPINTPRLSPTLRGESLFNTGDGKIALIAQLRAEDELNDFFGEGPLSYQIKKLFAKAKLTPPLLINGTKTVLISLKSGSWWNPIWRPVLILKRAGEIEVLRDQEALNWLEKYSPPGEESELILNQIKSSMGKSGSKKFAEEIKKKIGPKRKTFNYRWTYGLFYFLVFAGVLVLMNWVPFTAENMVTIVDAYSTLGPVPSPAYASLQQASSLLLFPYILNAIQTGGAPSTPPRRSDGTKLPAEAGESRFTVQSFLKSRLSENNGKDAAEHYLKLDKPQRDLFIRTAGPVLAGRLFHAISIYYRNAYITRLQERIPLLNSLQPANPENVGKLKKVFEQELKELDEINSMGVAILIPRDFPLKSEIENEIIKRKEVIHRCLKILDSTPSFPSNPEILSLKWEAGKQISLTVSRSTIEKEAYSFDLCPYFFHGKEDPLFSILFEIKKSLSEGKDGQRLRQELESFQGAALSADLHLRGLFEHWLLPANLESNEWNGKKTPISTDQTAFAKLEKIISETLNREDYPTAIVAVPFEGMKPMAMAEIHRIMNAGKPENKKEIYYFRPDKLEAEIPYTKLLNFIQSASELERGSVLIIDLDRLDTHLLEPRLKDLKAQLLYFLEQSPHPMPVLFLTSERADRGHIDNVDLVEFSNTPAMAKDWIDQEINILQEEHDLKFEKNIPSLLLAAMNNTDFACTIEDAITLLQRAAGQTAVRGNPIVLSSLMEELIAQLPSHSQMSFGKRVRAAAARCNDDFNKEVTSLYLKFIQRGETDAEKAVLRSRIENLLKLEHMFKRPDEVKKPRLTTHEIDTRIKMAQKQLRAHFSRFDDAIKKVTNTYLRTHLENTNNPSPRPCKILCLVGDPGAGKTTLSERLGEIMGFGIITIKCSNLKDASSITGDDHTYLGAQPSQITVGFQKTGKNKNLVILDEIGKISDDGVFQALLQVLDGKILVDSYLGSQVGIPLNGQNAETYFILTENSLEHMKKDPRYQAILDRIEIYNVRSYDEEDVTDIGEKHFLPEVIAKLKGVFDIGDKTSLVKQIVRDYLPSRPYSTRELRRLLRQVGSFAIHQKHLKKPIPNDPLSLIRSALGPPPPQPPLARPPKVPGEATGLAVKGENVGLIVQVQAGLVNDLEQPELAVTGLLGEDMKESLDTAVELVIKHCQQEKKDLPVYLQGIGATLNNIRFSVHIPDYGITKDGPSAGVTFYTGLVSALTKRRVRQDVAMTGEIDSNDRVKKIGGLKHKVSAARVNGFTTVIIPEENFNNLKEEVMPASPDYYGIVERKGEKSLFVNQLPGIETGYDQVFIVESLNHGFLLRGPPEKVDSWLKKNSSFVPPMTYVCVENVHEVIHHALEEKTQPAPNPTTINTSPVYELGSILLLIAISIYFLPNIFDFIFHFGLSEVEAALPWTQEAGLEISGLSFAIPALSMNRWRQKEMGDIVKENPPNPTDYNSFQTSFERGLAISLDSFAYLVEYWTVRNPIAISLLMEDQERKTKIMAGVSKAIHDSPRSVRALEVALSHLAATIKRKQWYSLTQLFKTRKEQTLAILSSLNENDKKLTISCSMDLYKHLRNDRIAINQRLARTPPNSRELSNLTEELHFHDSWIQQLEAVVPSTEQEAAKNVWERLLNLFKKVSTAPETLEGDPINRELLIEMCTSYIQFLERRVQDLSIRWPEKPSKPTHRTPDRTLLEQQNSAQFGFFYVAQADTQTEFSRGLTGKEVFHATAMLQTEEFRDFLVNESNLVSVPSAGPACPLSHQAGVQTLFETLERSGPRVLRFVSDSKEVRNRLPEEIAWTLHGPQSTPLGKTAQVFRLDLPQLDSYDSQRSAREIGTIAALLRTVENAVLVIDTQALSKFSEEQNINAMQILLDVASSPSNSPPLPIIIVSSTVDDAYLKDNSTLYELSTLQPLAIPGKDDFKTLAGRLFIKNYVSSEEGALDAIYPYLTDCRSYDLAVQALHRAIAVVRDSKHPVVTTEGLIQALSTAQQEKRKNLTKIERYEEAIAKIPDEAARFMGWSELGRLRRTVEGSPEYARLDSFLEILTGWPYKVKYQGPVAGLTWDDYIHERLIHAAKVLDENLFGLEDVKQQLMLLLSDHLESLSKGKKPDPIRLCLLGGSGSGKTSIAPIIAEIFEIPFIRVPCGGIKDDQILTGHRRVYVGSKPGEPVNQIEKVGQRNALILFDEGLKMENKTILLSLLDPDHPFIDNYTELEYDLSETAMVVTANLDDEIPEPVRDRMKVIPMDPPDANKIVEGAVKMILALLAEKGYPPDLFGNTEELRQVSRALVKGYLPEISFRRLEQELSALLVAVSNDPRFLQWITEQELGHFIASPKMTGRLSLDLVPALAKAFLAQTEVLDYANIFEMSLGKRMLTSLRREEKSKFQVTISDLERYLGPPRLATKDSTRRVYPGESIALIQQGREIECQAKLINNTEDPSAPLEMVYPRERPLIPADPGTGRPGNKLQVEGYQEILRVAFRLAQSLVPPKAGLGKKMLFHTSPTTPMGGSIGHGAVMALCSALLNRVPFSGTAFIGEPTATGDLLPESQLESTVMMASMSGNIQRYHIPEQNRSDLISFLSKPVSLNAWGVIEQTDGTWTIVFPSVHGRDLAPSAKAMRGYRERANAVINDVKLSKNSFGMEGVDNGMANAFTVSGREDKMLDLIKKAGLPVNIRYILVDTIAQSFERAFPPETSQGELPPHSGPTDKQKGFITLDYVGPFFLLVVLLFGLMPLAYTHAPVMLGATIMAIVGLAGAVRTKDSRSLSPLDRLQAGDIAALARWASTLDEPFRSKAQQLASELAAGGTKMTPEELEILAFVALQERIAPPTTGHELEQQDQSTAYTFLASLAHVAQNRRGLTPNQTDNSVIPPVKPFRINLKRIRQINAGA